MPAGRNLFAEHGYERTTIRSIAAAAEVDPGLVMQHFGAKDTLFAECVCTAAPEHPAASPLGYAVEMLASRMDSEPIASLALLRSMLTHPEAADELRQLPAEQQARFAAGIDVPDDLIGSVTLGVVLGRHLVRMDALSAADTGDIVELLRPCLQSLTGSPRT